MDLPTYRALLARAFGWSAHTPGTAWPSLRALQRCAPVPKRVALWPKHRPDWAAADAWLLSRVVHHRIDPGTEPTLAIMEALALDWDAGLRCAVLYAGVEPQDIRGEVHLTAPHRLGTIQSSASTRRDPS